MGGRNEQAISQGRNTNDQEEHEKLLHTTNYQGDVN